MEGLERDILFSIYQTTGRDETLEFSLQQVRRDNYYPPELQFLSERISKSGSQVELEKATEHFYNFVDNRKQELIKLYHQSLKLEQTNQRRIYVLVDQHGQALYRGDKPDLIYLGGPLGGGMMQLNEELTKIKQNKELELLSVDAKSVGRTLDTVTIEHDFLKTELTTEEGFTLESFPLQIEDYFITIERAAKYFEDQYQKLTMINDFSPIVDSSISAAEATLNAQSLYFNPLPSVVVQKFDQYSMDKNKEYPNFLGIQKTKEMMSNQVDEMEILGYSFLENGKEYSFVIDELYYDLKCFLLVEAPFQILERYFNILSGDSDLKWQIKEIQKNNNSFGKIDRINILNINPTIQDLVGIPSIQRKLDKLSVSNREIELPIGYVSISGSDPKNYIQTSLSRNQLPAALTPVLFDIKNSLDLLRTGSLEVLSFEADTIAVYLQWGSVRFKLEIRNEVSGNFDLVVYFLGDEIKTMLETLSSIGIDIPDKILSELSLPLGDRQYENIKQLLGKRLVTTKSNYTQQSSDFPLVEYVKQKLKPHVVEVLLKRILNEVREYERNESDNTDHIQEYYAKLADIEQIEEDLEDDELSSYIQQRLQYIETEENIHSKLKQLEVEINQYNSGLYSFLIDMLRRENVELVDSIEKLYEKVRNLFHDITVAIIDFGLTPEQWKFANNLQLWKSYQAQIGYMEHAITIQLREYIGNEYEGSNIEKLVDHQFTRGIKYESFHGNIQGERYINLKRVHLTFIPLLHKYSEKLHQTSNLDELVAILERLERERKEKVKSQLPGLPKGKSS